MPTPTASVHVLSSSARRPWHAVRSAALATRWLRARDDVPFFLCGRTTAGRGHRDIGRSLSLRRLVVVVEWGGADEAVAGRAALDDAWSDAGAEVWSASLVPFLAKGEWDGRAAFRPADGDAVAHDVVASLTCARIRPARLFAFYVRSFPKTARTARHRDSGMIAGLGFGSAVPIRDACTISFWPSSHDVTGFAYRDAPHDPVRRRSMEQGWLRESLFARFAVIDHAGTWSGVDPLA